MLTKYYKVRLKKPEEYIVNYGVVPKEVKEEVYNTFINMIDESKKVENYFENVCVKGVTIKNVEEEYKLPIVVDGKTYCDIITGYQLPVSLVGLFKKGVQMSTAEVEFYINKIYNNNASIDAYIDAVEEVIKIDSVCSSKEEELFKEYRAKEDEENKDELEAQKRISDFGQIVRIRKGIK